MLTERIERSATELPAELLSDEQILTRCDMRMPSEQQWAHHRKLLAKNEEGILTDKERTESEHLRTATDRSVFRRSYALAMLKWRGHSVFPATDLSS
ncbi:hypothetical protein QUF80_19535 [Desulfococcaceae bacterium HSG8]|nr:hypothetical protein [Desulfococcaceae bacterium HSG8]